jgi:hypothetical protein
LAGTDLLALTPGQQTAFVKAAAELVAAEMVDAERPEAHLNLGLLDMRRRNLTEAEMTARRCPTRNSRGTGNGRTHCALAPAAPRQIDPTADTL